jgi:Phage integrase, N-terminal SAM-like domain
MSAAAEQEVCNIAYDNFINSIRSDVTKQRYAYLLKRYMKYLKYDSIDKLLVQQPQPKAVESLITHYIVWLRQEQKLSAITVNQYIAAIMHFYAMNDIVLNRKKIGSGFRDTHKKYVPRNLGDRIIG